MALLGLEILMMLHMVLRNVGRWGTEAVWKSDPLPLLFYKSRFVGPRGELPEAEGPISLWAPAAFDPVQTTTGSGRDDGKLLTATVRVRFRKGAGKFKSAGLERQQLPTSKHSSRVTVLEREDNTHSRGDSTRS